MDKLLEVADQQASSTTTASLTDRDENLFQQFMGKNSVWDFYCISRDDYLCESKADKEQLILQYYNKMKMGGQLHYQFFVIVF